ncbi:hypothetical protein HAX54_030425 [Datura stramonium]|uniref:F-box domain-containing protein n=1 Tax=Datura stramonium TaxID=4076 RepID=A0ABS8SAZ7_DATST|nr:hypothetical protein [Datura stramonium]
MITNGDDESNNNLTIYLPEDVIHNIFTFLPIKHAISSSLVAKSFLNSWLYVRNLCFDINFETNCSVNGRDEIPIIDNILSNYLGEKIHRFSLYIPVSTRYLPFLKKWIQHVASKSVEEFELRLPRPTDESSYFMHSNCIDIETLYSLKLGCFSNDELIIKGSNKFKTLLIRDCEDISLVTIDNSSISTFHYDGEINKIKFANSIRLNDVLLNFGATTGLQHIRERDDLIKVFRNVQTLSINNILLEGLSPRFVNFEYKDMEYYLPNLKELQLVRHDWSFINLWDIVFFVKNRPQIQRLFIDFGDYAMEAGSYWNIVAKENFENCETEFRELKLLKVKGFKALELEKN